jgi:uncharacterized membrane protein YecN with MAPEG domain
MMNAIEFGIMAIILMLIYNEIPAARQWIIVFLVIIIFALTLLHYTDIRNEFGNLASEIRAKTKGQTGATR